jgi:hypothetical protein
MGLALGLEYTIGVVGDLHKYSVISPISYEFQWALIRDQYWAAIYGFKTIQFLLLQEMTHSCDTCQIKPVHIHSHFNKVLKKFHTRRLLLTIISPTIPVMSRNSEVNYLTRCKMVFWYMLQWIANSMVIFVNSIVLTDINNNLCQNRNSYPAR